MNNFPVILDRFIFEVRYGAGYRYFDRCGQSLIDITQQSEGWLPLTVNPQTGTLENPEKRFTMSFNDSFFNFTADKPYHFTIDEIAEEVALLWKIVQVNLGLEEYLRLATRLYYFLPCLSIEDAEKRLSKSALGVSIPTKFGEIFNIKHRHSTVIFEKDNIEFRVVLNTITRHEGLQPTEILAMDPRFLSKDQRKYRLAKQKQLMEYSSNPMYAVGLDVDCVIAQPETINARDFIIERQQNIKDYFLPLMENL
jgi:hypothetical protein